MATADALPTLARPSIVPRSPSSAPATPPSSFSPLAPLVVALYDLDIDGRPACQQKGQDNGEAQRVKSAACMREMADKSCVEQYSLPAGAAQMLEGNDPYRNAESQLALYRQGPPSSASDDSCTISPSPSLTLTNRTCSTSGSTPSNDVLRPMTDQQSMRAWLRQAQDGFVPFDNACRTKLCERRLGWLNLEDYIMRKTRTGRAYSKYRALGSPDASSGDMVWLTHCSSPPGFETFHDKGLPMHPVLLPSSSWLRKHASMVSHIPHLSPLRIRRHVSGLARTPVVLQSGTSSTETSYDDSQPRRSSSSLSKRAHHMDAYTILACEESHRLRDPAWKRAFDEDWLGRLEHIPSEEKDAMLRLFDQSAFQWHNHAEELYSNSPHPASGTASPFIAAAAAAAADRALEGLSTGEMAEVDAELMRLCSGDTAAPRGRGPKGAHRTGSGQTLNIHARHRGHGASRVQNRPQDAASTDGSSTFYSGPAAVQTGVPDVHFNVMAGEAANRALRMRVADLQEHLSLVAASQQRARGVEPAPSMTEQQMTAYGSMEELHWRHRQALAHNLRMQEQLYAAQSELNAVTGAIPAWHALAHNFDRSVGRLDAGQSTAQPHHPGAFADSVDPYMCAPSTYSEGEENGAMFNGFVQYEATPIAAQRRASTHDTRGMVPPIMLTLPTPMRNDSMVDQRRVSSASMHENGAPYAVLTSDPGDAYDPRRIRSAAFSDPMSPSSPTFAYSPQSDSFALLSEEPVQFDWRTAGMYGAMYGAQSAGSDGFHLQADRHVPRSSSPLSRYAAPMGLYEQRDLARQNVQHDQPHQQQCQQQHQSGMTPAAGQTMLRAGSLQSGQQLPTPPPPKSAHATTRNQSGVYGQPSAVSHIPTGPGVHKGRRHRVGVDQNGHHEAHPRNAAAGRAAAATQPQHTPNQRARTRQAHIRSDEGGPTVHQQQQQQKQQQQLQLQTQQQPPPQLSIQATEALVPNNSSSAKTRRKGAANRGQGRRAN